MIKELKNKIERILVHNFDNDQYQWSNADKELRSLLDKAHQLGREEGLTEAEEVARNLDVSSGQSNVGDEADTIAQAISQLKESDE